MKLNMDMAKYQIVFLDINMEELNGISTAKRLRELCKDTFVVFVTAFIKYALDAILYQWGKWNLWQHEGNQGICKRGKSGKRERFNGFIC